MNFGVILYVLTTYAATSYLWDSRKFPCFLQSFIYNVQNECSGMTESESHGIEILKKPKVFQIAYLNITHK